MFDGKLLGSVEGVIEGSAVGTSVVGASVIVDVGVT